MRRLFAILFALVLVPLAAAAQSQAPLVIKPSVMVYPFTASTTTIDREASSRLATLIATQMANTKLVTVIPAPPGTARKDYLAVARQNSADFYVAGYISALGSGVSVVEQVVSTQSGIVTFSNTAQLTTYADAAGQGDDLATAIGRYANRGLASIPSPPPAASPTPVAEGAQANIGNLFGRRRKPSAQPSATPSARPAVASATTPAPAATSVAVAQVKIAPTAAPGAAQAFVVVPVEGTADELVRTAAVRRLVDRLGAQNATSTNAACLRNTGATVVGGILAEQADAKFGGYSATFQLIVRDCSGKTLFNTSYERSGGSETVAMASAVDAALGDYTAPPRRRRR